jgi:hypothetical protein
MDKKYQVFISSTYMDMKAERQAAVQAVLDAGHIPAGMELFAASDEGQMQVIKQWIDESDIFMLVLGGRYGSIEPESGKSYIQLEYEYAVVTNKPFFALCLSDAAINDKIKLMGGEAIEKGDSKKLNDFRGMVRSKMCSDIEDVKDILIHTPKSIRQLAARRDLVGWVRSSEVPNISTLVDEISELRAQNEVLKKNQRNLPSGLSAADANGDASSVDLKEMLTLKFSYRLYSGLTLQEKHDVWTGSYESVFVMIGPKLLDEPSDSAVQTYLNAMVAEKRNVQNLQVAESDYQLLKLKLVKLGAIELRRDGPTINWILTGAGKSRLLQGL